MCFVHLRKLLILRREMRFVRIELFIYSMRFVLLVGVLKLVGHSYLHPITMSICGWLQASCGIFKSMRSKKNFVKFETDDLDKYNDDVTK